MKKSILFVLGVALLTSCNADKTNEGASELLNQANLPAGLLKAYNLSMWAQLVEQAAMMLTSDLDFENGMDRRLIQHCYDKKIEVRDVESPELQYGLLASSKGK